MEGESKDGRAVSTLATLQEVAERNCREAEELAEDLCEKADFVQAETNYRKALAIRETALGPYHPEVATSLHQIGDVLRASGKFDDADMCYEKALCIREHELGATSTEVAETLGHRAEALRAKGDNDGAEPLFRRAVAIYDGAPGADPLDVACLLNNFASFLHERGRPREALCAVQRAADIFETELGASDPKTKIAASWMAFLEAACAGFGWTWPKSDANFLLADVGSAPLAAALYAKLKENGILVRYWGARPELCSKLRITVGAREGQLKFVDIVTKHLAEDKK